MGSSNPTPPHGAPGGRVPPPGGQPPPDAPQAATGQPAPEQPGVRRPGAATRQAERERVLAYVRTHFDPPLPDAFADWYLYLRHRRDLGDPMHTPVNIPSVITDQGYVVVGTDPATGMVPMVMALAAFRPLEDGDTRRAPRAVAPVTQGATDLAAALTVMDIRSQVTIDSATGDATVKLSNEHAAQLAARLLPDDGTLEDDLAQALELLGAFTDDPKPEPCHFDHHGHCQEHGRELDGRCAQPLAHAFLIKHNVRGDDT